MRPDFSSLFTPDKTTTPRPTYQPVEPKPIKPVEEYHPKTPFPVYPLPDEQEEPPVEESKQLATVAGTPMSIVVVVGVAIFLVNCIALGLIFYYHRRKLKSQNDRTKVEEQSKEVSEDDSEGFHKIVEGKEHENERKSRKKKRSTDESQESNSESVSRVSSLSRESSSRRKHSQSQEPSTSEQTVELKVEENKSIRSHKRSKSDHSFYNEIGKEDHKELDTQEARQSKIQLVKFNTMTTQSGKNLNRSTTSIASKSSVKSTSSRASARSVASRTSVKSGASVKAVKKNASCQSLPTSDNSWTLTKESGDNPSNNQSEPSSDKKHNLAIMQKRNYPKVLPDPNLEVVNSATLPRIRPPPPPRSTSLTARDIQELEKLQEAYRKTRPPRHASTDSCELSGSELFYSMGGGEAPARAPGLMYGPTLLNTNSVRRGSRKGDGIEYDEYQKYQPTYQIRETALTAETQIASPKPYQTYGENRAPRGPLASFNKLKDQPLHPMNYEIGRGSSTSPISTIPPPVPAHQVPLTPSILKNPVPPSISDSQSSDEVKSEVLQTSSSLPIFEQTENTGTVKRQKPKSAPTTPGTDALDKPLKSVLKSTSAYDKPKGNNNSNVSNINPILAPVSSKTALPAVFSASSASSTSPSLSSGGSNLPSPTELKSILVKRQHRVLANSKNKMLENDSVLN